MREEDKTHEGTWQHPEHKGRGGAANAPGDTGEDRENADGSPAERSGWSREERESGFGQITERNAVEAADAAEAEGDNTPYHKTQPGTQIRGGGTQGLEQGPPPAESAEGESGV